jgi:phosphatidate cytidylyltransferase
MLKQRVQSAFIMLGLFILTYFYLEYIFFEFLVLAVGGFLLFELSNLLKLNKLSLAFFWFFASTPLFIYFIGTFTSNFGNFLNLSEYSYFTNTLYPLISNFLSISIPFLASLSLIFWLFIVPVDIFYKRLSSNPLIKIFYGLFLITPMLLSTLSIFMTNKNILLTIILMIWLADIGAYFSGKKFGKIKLAKRISPGKTLEGLIGGFLSNIIFISFLYIYGFVSIFDGMLLAFLVTTLSLYGDIYESFLKRIANIKDSSSLIPGHGGFLDRMDSFCPTIPILYYLLKAFEYL